MDFFTKFLKMNHSSHSPSPGPSSSHQNEGLEEPPQMKEKTKQGNEKSKVDHFYHNFENLLKPAKDGKKHENTLSNSSHLKEEFLHEKESPLRAVKYEHSGSENQLLQKSDNCSRSPSREKLWDSSHLPPRSTDLNSQRLLEGHRESSTEDSLYNLDRFGEQTEREALDAMKSNIEVLAYLKKSELTERHKENRTRPEPFLLMNSDYQQIVTEDMSLEAVGAQKIEALSFSSEDKDLMLFKDSSNTPNNNDRSQILTANSGINVVTKPLKPYNISIEGHSQSIKEDQGTNDSLDKNVDYSSFGEIKSKINQKLSIQDTGCKKENAGLVASDLNTDTNGNNKENIKQIEASAIFNQTSENIRLDNSTTKANQLTQQTEPTISLSLILNEQKNNITKRSPENISAITQGKNNPALTDDKDVLLSENIPDYLADSRDSNKNSSLGINKMFKTNMHLKDKENEDYVLVTDEIRVNSQRITQDCLFEKISKQIISSVSDSCDNAVEINDDTSRFNIMGDKISDYPEDKGISDAYKQCSIKNNNNNTNEESKRNAEELVDDSRLTSIKGDVLNHPKESKKLQTCKRYTSNINQNENSIEKIATNEETELPLRVEVKESNPGDLRKGSTPSFMNIYMSGDVGNALKIERVGEMYISDSSRKSSGKSLEDEVDGFQINESDTEFESDSLERSGGSTPVSGSGDEGEFDFDIEFVDDIDERLSSGQDGASEGNVRNAGSSIQDKLNKLFNSLDDDDNDGDDDNDHYENGLIKAHEDINIHVPTDYLTVQRPRAKKRSLRIRLSPVIEMLDESISPKILFDINDMSQFELNDVLSTKAVIREKSYDYDHISCKRAKCDREIEELEKGTSSDQNTVSLREAGSDWEDKTNVPEDSDSQNLPSDCVNESQVRIMIYSASSNFENPISTNENFTEAFENKNLVESRKQIDNDDDDYKKQEPGKKIEETSRNTTEHLSEMNQVIHSGERKICANESTNVICSNKNIHLIETQGKHRSTDGKQGINTKIELTLENETENVEKMTNKEKKERLNEEKSKEETEEKDVNGESKAQNKQENSSINQTDAQNSSDDHYVSERTDVCLESGSFQNNHGRSGTKERQSPEPYYSTDLPVITKHDVTHCVISLATSEAQHIGTEADIDTPNERNQNNDGGKKVVSLLENIKTSLNEKDIKTIDIKNDAETANKIGAGTQSNDTNEQVVFTDYETHEEGLKYFNADSNLEKSPEEENSTFEPENVVNNTVDSCQTSSEVKEDNFSTLNNKCSESTSSNFAPVSLKELCEATIYDDFENRNADSLSQEDETFLTTDIDDYDLFNDISYPGGSDEDFTINNSQDRITIDATSRKSFTGNTTTIQFSGDDSLTRGKKQEKGTNSLIQETIKKEENFELKTEIDRLTPASESNTLEVQPWIDNKKIDSYSNQEKNKTDKTSILETIGVTNVGHLDRLKGDVVTSMQETDESSVIKVGSFHETLGQTVDVCTELRPKELKDKFILLKIPDAKNILVDRSSTKLDIPFGTLSTHLEWVKKMSPVLPVHFQSDISSDHVCPEINLLDLINQDWNPPIKLSSSTDGMILSIASTSDDSTKSFETVSTEPLVKTTSTENHECDVKHSCRLLGYDKNSLEKENMLELLKSKEIEITSLKESNKNMEEELRQLIESKRCLEERLQQPGKNDIPATDAQSEGNNTTEIKVVMREYEEIIAGLMEIVERDRSEFDKERHNLQKEVTELISHLNSLELAFNDIHLKYEKSKIVIAGFKTNEELLKQCISDMEMVIVNHEKRYSSLKEHATCELNRASEELDSMKKNYETKLASYNDLLKKCEVQLKSLHDIVNQKMEENASLMKICDDLIKKVSDINH